MSQPSRPRVFAAVLSADHQDILMVQHRRQDGTSYWQFPGGGVQLGESLEGAVLRELREETGLHGHVVRCLFTIPYKYGLSTTFLVSIQGELAPNLGIDPEEVNADHRKLVAVSWQPLSIVENNPEVIALMDAMRTDLRPSSYMSS